MDVGSSALVGSSTRPLASFSSPPASSTRRAYSAIPDRSSLVRNATAPVLELAVASAWFKTARKPGVPGILLFFSAHFYLGVAE